MVEAENLKQTVQEKVEIEKQKRKDIKEQIKELKLKNKEAQMRIDNLTSHHEDLNKKSVRLEEEVKAKFNEHTNE